MGVPGIFNHREALAPSIVCPEKKVRNNNIMVAPSITLLNFPICSYLKNSIPLIRANPTKTNIICLITCPVVVPLFTMYSKLELAEYTGNTENTEIIIMTIQRTLSPFRNSNLLSVFCSFITVVLKKVYVIFRYPIFVLKTSPIPFS